MNKISNCIIASLLLAMTGSLHAATQQYCGELKNHYGPYDFRNRASGRLEVVENAHFTSEVENGIRGHTSWLGDDLDYTLRAIPNHPRALTTIANVSIRTNKLQVYGAKFPTECYFIRAIQFAPDDGVVRAAYGNYLTALGKPAQALEMFKYAVQLEPENASFNYNLGLLYLKMKEYDKAAQCADKAYSLGFPLPGLKNQLAAVRKGDATTAK